MHGCGNDFLVCEAITRPIALEAGQIERLADRHYGVGFDQLLMIEPPLRATSDFALAIYNSDGSAAGHCGNGARCVARFVYDKGFSHKRTLVWDIVSRDMPARCFVTSRLDDTHCEVDMGVPAFAIDKMPATLKTDARPLGEFRFATGTVEFTPVDLGNPHAVIMVDDLENALFEGIEGVNAGYCQVIDRARLRLRVFERGVGETLACGSGACAAVVAGRLSGDLDASTRVELPGGGLRIEWEGEGEAVWMTGPTAWVFDSEIEL